MSQAPERSSTDTGGGTSDHGISDSINSDSEKIPADTADDPLDPAISSSSNGTGGFSSKRFIGKLISSAAQHIQGIEREPADLRHPMGMLSNVGQIKLRPDPATVLVHGSTGIIGGRDKHKNNDTEAASISAGQRPGLLSQYLRLMHLDRKGSAAASIITPTPSVSRERANIVGSGGSSGQHTVSRARTDDDMWTDTDNNAEHQAVSTATRTSALGVRRRKVKARYSTGGQQSSSSSWRLPFQSRSNTPNSPPSQQATNSGRHSSSTTGFFANAKKRTPRSTVVSPLGTTPLANTPGVPFRHLSEALPWASSQRQQASVSACCTPLALTRRQSVSSVIGDISTVVRHTTDNIGDGGSGSENGGGGGLFSLKPAFGQLKSHQTSTAEQQNIVHAIDLLLLHQRFLVLIAKALMVYGSPLHYLEDNLCRIARLLDLEVTVSAIPGLILLSFEDSVTHTSETKLIRCANGWDMHRLDQTNQLLRRVVYGQLEIQGAVHSLEEIMTAAPIYAWYFQVLNWGVISWALCLVCFGGSWKDSGISLALGLMAGCLNLAAQKFSGYTNFFEVSVSILVGLFSAALANWSGGCFGATSLSATVVLLPGLVMTTGVIELSSRHMVAGTVRIFYALLLAFIIAYGLLIGVQIYNQMAGNSAINSTLIDLTQCHGLSQWSWFGTFPLGIISISILVNIHWRHWISVTMVAGISYGIFWLFKFHLKLDDLAPVVASFVLGLVANIWSKFTGQTAYMIMLPGEMFLVPGSVGVRGFASLLIQDGGSSGGQGAQLAIQMITTCLSIMMGLFASSFMVYPRGKQNSAILTV